MIRPAGRAAAVALALALAACSESVYAPAEEARARAWVEPGPPTLTLVTAVSNRDGSGGHSALMVSGGQRVIFDPRGHVVAPARAPSGAT